MVITIPIPILFKPGITSEAIYSIVRHIRSCAAMQLFKLILRKFNIYIQDNIHCFHHTHISGNVQALNTEEDRREVIMGLSLWQNVPHNDYISVCYLPTSLYIYPYKLGCGLSSSILEHHKRIMSLTNTLINNRLD